MFLSIKYQIKPCHIIYLQYTYISKVLRHTDNCSVTFVLYHGSCIRYTLQSKLYWGSNPSINLCFSYMYQVIPYNQMHARRLITLIFPAIWQSNSFISSVFWRFGEAWRTMSSAVWFRSCMSSSLVSMSIMVCWSSRFWSMTLDSRDFSRDTWCFNSDTVWSRSVLCDKWKIILQYQQLKNQLKGIPVLINSRYIYYGLMHLGNSRQYNWN